MEKRVEVKEIDIDETLRLEERQGLLIYWRVRA